MWIIEILVRQWGLAEIKDQTKALQTCCGSTWTEQFMTENLPDWTERMMSQFNIHDDRNEKED